MILIQAGGMLRGWVGVLLLANANLIAPLSTVLSLGLRGMSPANWSGFNTSGGVDLR